MEKAYDVKELAKIAQSKGLNIAEEAALELLNSVEEWALESAKLGKHGIVDAVVLVAVPQVVKLGKDLADKIDGQVG